MTTITPFAAGSYRASRNTTQLLALKSQLDTLSTQLSTGRTAQTYAGLGGSRTAALSAQGTISALTGYATGIDAAQTRTKLAVTSLSHVATVGANTRTDLLNGLQSTSFSSATDRDLARNNLDSALDALNQSSGSDYLFGGRNGATQPVLDADTILNGTTNPAGKTLAGLKTLVAEQTAADLGANGNGRLVQTAPGAQTPGGTALGATQVSLSEDASATARANFGFSIAGKPAVTGSAITVSSYAAATAGSPAAFTLDVGSQPAVGDSVTLTLNLHDGTSTTLTLKAVAGGAAASSTGATFAIDPDPGVTAANLSHALGGALAAAAGSTLKVSSTVRATQDFFTGSASAGVLPHRVVADANGNPTYVSATPNDTVIWYQGEDSGTDPRATQAVQVSATSTVQTGVRANETPIRNVLAGLATVALGLPDANDAHAGATYQAIIARAGALLDSAGTSPSVQDRVTDLSLASARLSDAATTNTAARNTLQDTVDGIEQAPTQEVAAKLLDLQNRLQASYQITASLSKLSLINYMS